MITFTMHHSCKPCLLLQYVYRKHFTHILYNYILKLLFLSVNDFFQVWGHFAFLFSCVIYVHFIYLFYFVLSHFVSLWRLLGFIVCHLLVILNHALVIFAYFVGGGLFLCCCLILCLCLFGLILCHFIIISSQDSVIFASYHFVVIPCLWFVAVYVSLWMFRCLFAVVLCLYSNFVFPCTYLVTLWIHFVSPCDHFESVCIHLSLTL